MLNFLRAHRSILIYSAAMAVLLVILRWLELRFIIFSHSFEVYAGAIAFLFTALGIWLPTALRSRKWS